MPAVPQPTERRQYGDCERRSAGDEQHARHRINISIVELARRANDQTLNTLRIQVVNE